MGKVIAQAILIILVAVTTFTASHFNHYHPAIEAYNASNLYRDYTATISKEEVYQWTAEVENDDYRNGSL
ncbi:hypothetical protein [Desulfofalx alkaliphila]|uniref:hypothetical protein n=1 Tax=Desulfofalx alkaliphila TaxID=105483 RepID=UPI0004E25F75|nr:hypothetical protein [Desulfofalx alkaliphila]